MIRRTPVAGSHSKNSGFSSGAHRVRLMIAEDHPVMRTGLVDLLEQEPTVELVGCADNSRDAAELVRTTDPHILVLDLTLGEDDGVVLARRLLGNRPHLKIIVLSMHDEQ